jgi:hypothetical protein
MASWWMNENGDEDDQDESRKTISKRNHFPENWIASQEPVTFKGLLEKKRILRATFIIFWFIT